MKDKYFLDTNIFVYSFDKKNRKKQATAQNLIDRALEESNGVISSQVVQEFLNVATRKFANPLDRTDSKIYLDAVLAPLCEIFPGADLYCQTLDIQDETKYSFYDSLIVAAALEGNCNILYSEDMQNGQIIRELKIINPFSKIREFKR